MPAHLWKRANGMFYVVDGSTMFTTRTRSGRLAGARLGQYLNRQYSPNRILRLRLSEVAPEYLTWCEKFNKPTTLSDKARTLKYLIAATKDSLIGNVSSKDVFDCLSGRQISAARWNNDRIFIGHLFTFLDRYYGPTKGRIPNPVREVIRQPVVRSRLRHSLSVAEEKNLLEYLRVNDKELYHYAILDGHTGLRVGELSNLRWPDVDFEARKIRVSMKVDWSPKGYRERWVPMDDRCARVLRLLKAKSISHYVCCRRDGRKYVRGLDLRMVR
ncbi:MAG: tyrosine-type recombinase/integrase, partial [Deltaproteobacteria bacterium]|nr:tyrosine-type recombinase/integrase [Deltaproteobacteria bacterium]